MLPVLWEINKLEYEPRGRKFILETDHKALKEIRRKTNFNNNRINRWIGKIQEYDFGVLYIKREEIEIVDSLSRSQHKEKITDKNNFKAARWEKHVKQIGNKEV